MLEYCGVIKKLKFLKKNRVYIFIVTEKYWIAMY